MTLVPARQAGDFSLRTDVVAKPAAQTGFAQQDDIALVLHTSGTTSRPKIVPLSHVNVTASAYHIGQSLALTPQDVCLNIMPLFHIHGLIAATLSSIAAGASVVCTPGFNALKFFGWYGEANPTWYTAVPTMHQAILARADRNTEIIKKGRLRLVRSSSASLPPQVMAQLEAAFCVPVIEAYGMTEAAHQMASNPLPPHPRFSGCVGIAAGPEVGIMDESGALLPSGDLGEIVIRGRNVTQGYEANPEANRTAFINGWFRTGDQGVIDADGYLRLTGRLKELINRGGEKISPLEVDTIIMDHPAVAQVVTFGMPRQAVVGGEVRGDERRGEPAELRQLGELAVDRVDQPFLALLVDVPPHQVAQGGGELGDRLAVPGNVGEDEPGDDPSSAERHVMDVASGVVGVVGLADHPDVEAGGRDRAFLRAVASPDLHATHGMGFGRLVQGRLHRQGLLDQGRDARQARNNDQSPAESSPSAGGSVSPRPRRSSHAFKSSAGRHRSSGTGCPFLAIKVAWRTTAETSRPRIAAESSSVKPRSSSRQVHSSVGT